MGGPRVCSPQNIPRGTGSQKNYSNRKQSSVAFCSSVILPFCLQVLESFSDRRTYSVEQVSTRVLFSSMTYHSVEQEVVQSLASAFQQLEKCKSEFNIEDYSLSQTTLEQVVRSGNGKDTRNHQQQLFPLANIKPEPVCPLNFDVLRPSAVLHKFSSLIYLIKDNMSLAQRVTVIFQRCSSNLQSNRSLRTATRRTQSKIKQNDWSWIFFPQFNCFALFRSSRPSSSSVHKTTMTTL